MGYTQNLITSEDSKFFSTVGNWLITGATASIEPVYTFNSSWGSLKLTPVNSSTPIVMTLTGIPLIHEFNNDDLQFHVRVKSPAVLEVTIQLETSEDGSETAFTKATSSSWVLCRSANVFMPQTGADGTASVEITIEDHQGQNVLVAIPFLTYSRLFMYDLFRAEVRRLLPSFIQDADVAHQSQYGPPGWPLSRFIELVTQYPRQVIQDWVDFQYVDIAGGKIVGDPLTLSQMVDPVAAQRRFLKWLGLFVGVSIKNPALGTTPWASLPETWGAVESDIDPAPNDSFTPSAVVRSTGVVTATIGSHSVTAGMWVRLEGSSSAGTSFDGSFEITAADATTISWDQAGPDESATSVGVVYVSDTEWDELLQFAPALDDFDGNLRWQVRTGYGGLNAGTGTALRAAVAEPLLGDKIVTIIERYNSSAWEILVRTKTSETPDGVEGEPSERVVSYIDKVKPAGFKVTHECTATGA